MQRDFRVKNCKNGQENLYLTEYRLRKNEMWCDADNYNNICHICAKGVLDSNLKKAVIDKISNFQEIAPNFTYLQQSYFLKYNWNFLNQLLLYFMAGAYKECTFSFLPVVSR